MRRLVLWTGVVLAITAILIIAARNYGNQINTPNGFETIGMGVCESLEACVSGFTPYITDKTKGYEFDTVYVTGDGEYKADISVKFDGYYNETGSLYISFEDYPAANVVALIEQYGSPCIIVYNKVYNSMVLRYPSFFAITVAFTPQQTTLPMDWPIDQMTVAKDQRLCSWSDNLDEPDIFYSHWRGFASLQRYITK